jgi:hypothetical protein
MPRKNKNARPRNVKIRSRRLGPEHHRLLEPLFEPIEIHHSEILSKYVKNRGIKEKPQIKYTPEQIVRDFRKNEGLDVYTQSMAVRPLFQGRFRNGSRPFFLIRWFKAIDWGFFLFWRRS